MVVRTLLGAAMAAALFIAPAQAQLETWWRVCRDSKAAPDERIRTCTSIIQSKQETQRNRARAYSNRGGARRDKDENDAAIADYTEAIRLDPKYAFAYNGRGLVYEDINDYDRAFSDYDRAIQLDPKYGYAYSNRADIYRYRGDLDRAIADYNRALQLKTEFPAIAYRGRASAWRAKGDFNRAIADYNEAIRLAPNDAVNIRNRGYTYFHQGDFTASAADLLRAIELRDDSYAMLFRYLARARGGQNATAELEANASRLKSKAWPYAAIELYLGRRSPEATLDAAGKTAERCEAEFYIGEWHLIRGEREQARARLQKAVDTCPKDFVEYDAANAELSRLGR